MTPDEFLANHGFPGTPAGDRMKTDLEKVLETRFDGLSRENASMISDVAEAWRETAIARGNE